MKCFWLLCRTAAKNHDFLKLRRKISLSSSLFNLLEFGLVRHSVFLRLAAQKMAAFELNLDVVEHQTECGNYEILYQEEGFNDSNFEFVDVQETKPFFKKKKKFKPKIKFGVPQTSKPFACEKCPYRAKNKGSLKKHQLTHSKEKPFRCPICEKGLKSKMALIHHVNSHKGNKPHACRYCDARFTSQSGMTRHVK